MKRNINKTYFSSFGNTIELVGYGHIDRFSDYIGELVLENLLKEDPNSKVALEILITRKKISLGGEITSKIKLDYNKLIYDAIEDIYGEKWWPNYKNVVIQNNIEPQSIELKKIQDSDLVAGDQGIVFGYYNKVKFEIIENLYSLMNGLIKKFDIAPDWKLLYEINGSNEISMSVCGDVNFEEIKKEIKNNNFNLLFKKIIINNGGKWLIPGARSDSGVIGRKLMIDTFGAGVPHGGGAFCGKDPSKVDKTGVLWASLIAKNFAKIKHKREVLVEMNFKIGDSYPVIFINSKKIENSEYKKYVSHNLNGFVKNYNLTKEKWSTFVKNGSSVLNWLKSKSL